MKRLAQSLLLLSVSASVVAEPIFHPAGENLGEGPIANYETVNGYTNNPATGASGFDVNGGGFGFGLAPSVGVGYEFGPIDGMAAQIDDLSKQLNDFSNNPTPTLANTIKDKFSSFLIEADKKGYLQAHVGVNPIAPIVWNSKDWLGASFVLNLNASAEVQANILTDRTNPIVYNPLATDPTKALQTNTAIYLKAAAVGESSLGFSRPVYSNDNGTLSAGVRGKFYMVDLRKKAVSVAQTNDINSVIKDEAKVKVAGQTGYGVDLGLTWASKHYRLGGTVRNINAPSFKYNELGQDCASKTGSAQDSCYIEESFSNRIDMKEKWVMDPQVNLQAALYNETRRWFLAATADTSAVNDPVGNQYQWVTASTGYTGRWLIPIGFRIGYRKNLAGTQLSAATAGLTLLKILHVDVAYGLETVKYQDSSTSTVQQVPRMAQANVGIDFMF